jgi:hypothetical protein
MNIEKWTKIAITVSIAHLFLYIFLYFFYDLDPSNNKNIKEAVESFSTAGVYPSEAFSGMFVGMWLISLILFYWNAWKNSRASLYFYIINLISLICFTFFDESALSVSYSMLNLYESFSYAFDGFIIACIFISTNKQKIGAPPN